MATVYYDDDADLSLLDGKKIAIIGYGSQGHAHALNLKDSGCDVVVGLYEGSKSREKAEAEGLAVESVADAVKASSVTMVLLPDTIQRDVYQAEILEVRKAKGDDARRQGLPPPPGTRVLVCELNPDHKIALSQFKACLLCGKPLNRDFECPESDPWQYKRQGDFSQHRAPARHNNSSLFQAPVNTVEVGHRKQ